MLGSGSQGEEQNDASVSLRGDALPQSRAPVRSEAQKRYRRPRSSRPDCSKLQGTRALPPSTCIPQML